MSFIRAKFNIIDADLNRYLNEALSRGGDFADLYFEYVVSTSVGLEEAIVKSATQGIAVGCGVRVIHGEKTGYAYSDDLTTEKIVAAARTAAHIADGPASAGLRGFAQGPRRELYAPAANDMSLAEKTGFLRRADAAARACDPRVNEVIAGYGETERHVLIATSEGLLSHDSRPMARLDVSVLAGEGANRQRGSDGGGGRVGAEFFRSVRTPEDFAREAARQAIAQLDAAEAPAGEMTVVLGPGWPGILLHEAVGHGLEADFNRKGVSAFSGAVGRKVASELCTVIDDGAIAERRGSLNVDDEGNATSRTVLIEKGILKGYMNDRLSSRLTGAPATGNGRRQSYKHIPMPRMTNTFMLAGGEDPADIVRSVKRGLYCVNFGGGQVDIVSGKFVFSASESYLIEDGKATRPVRGATLIGNGPDILTRVSRVGADLKLDNGVGVCGKEGQSVPVGVGIPTVRIDGVTVGGTHPARGATFR